MINYTYPTTRQLKFIEPEKIIQLQRTRPTFQLFPEVVDNNAWRIEWQQRDNYRGLQQLRGLNGEPSYVKRVGFKRYSQEPGVWGEYMTVDEQQMTTRAQYTDPSLQTPVSIDDLVTECQDYLLTREVDLKEWMHWAILLSGTFTIMGPTGAQYSATFPIQTATFSNWTIHNTGTPIADYMGLRVLTRGHSVSWGANSQSFMNIVTSSHLFLNTNPLDLGGKSIGFLGLRTGTPININEVNNIFVNQNIPTVVEYDEGYLRESDGAFTLWLPDNVTVIVGRRTNGDPLGEHRLVKNINNPGNTAGRYIKVIDNIATDVPRKISVHQGHNGGLVVWYPSAIIKATTGS